MIVLALSFLALLENNMTKDVFITVRTQFEALHRYKDAPDDVQFLSDLHRHIFYVSVSLMVGHDDREIEFFQMKRDIEKICAKLFEKSEWEYGLPIIGSCEEFAGKLGEAFIEAYTTKGVYIPSLEVIVSEDRENEARVFYS